MPDRQEYLFRLEAELRKTLSSDEVESMVAEAKGHLDDSIQARLELGLSLEDAEREALAAFGDARSFSRAICGPLYAASVTVRLRWMVAADLLLAACYARFDLLSEAVPFLAPILLVGMALCGVGLATCSFRNRTAASLQILAAGLASSLFFWTFFGIAWLNLWQYGGEGYTSRWVDYAFLDPSKWEPLRSAIADPVGNWTSQIGSGFGIGMGIAAIFAAIDLIAARLGTICAKFRRRRGIV